MRGTTEQKGGEPPLEETKKGQSSRPDCPRKRAQKKAQYPYIGHCAVKKIRLSLYQVERFIIIENRPALIYRLDLPYIKVSFFRFMVNPR